MENTVEMIEASVEEVTPVSAEQLSSASISIEEEPNVDEVSEEEESEEMPEDGEASDEMLDEEETEAAAGEEE